MPSWSCASSPHTCLARLLPLLTAVLRRRAYNRAQPQWRTVFRRAAGANIADNPAALFAEWLTCEGLHGGPADHADALRRVEVQQKILADRYAQALSAQAAAATAANEAPAEPRRRAAAARRTAESVESLPKADGPASKGEKVVSKVAEPVPKVDKPPPAEGATEGTNLSEPKKRTRAEDTSYVTFMLRPMSSPPPPLSLSLCLPLLLSLCPAF